MALQCKLIHLISFKWHQEAPQRRHTWTATPWGHTRLPECHLAPLATGTQGKLSEVELDPLFKQSKRVRSPSPANQIRLFRGLLHLLLVLLLLVHSSYSYTACSPPLLSFTISFCIFLSLYISFSSYTIITLFLFLILHLPLLFP